MNKTLEQTTLQIVKLFESILGIQPITHEQGFVSLGGDSVSAVLLSESIEEELGCFIGVRKIYTLSTPSAIATHIYNHQSS